MKTLPTYENKINQAIDQLAQGDNVELVGKIKPHIEKLEDTITITEK